MSAGSDNTAVSTETAAMPTQTIAELPKTTVLHPIHAELGASFTDFGGWLMPLKYGSELAEHRAVRERAGLFDLSHMGEIWVEGPEASRLLNTACVGDIAAARIGAAKYSMMLNDSGGIIDDLICYRLAEDRFLVVPNAGNTGTVVSVLTELAAGFDVRVSDVTAETSLVAVQGPLAAQIVRSLVTHSEHEAFDALKYYAVIELTVELPVELPFDKTVGLTTVQQQVLVARTGYTGEDGFELYIANEHACDLWQQLLQAGTSAGLVPAGLAARDSLRLEAGMPLYGNELSNTVTPVEAGLHQIVSLRKAENFVGRAVIEGQLTDQPQKMLVGLRGLGKRAGRSGYAVHLPGGTTEADQIGVVTSGQPSPTLGYPISMAYVAREYSAPATKLEIDLRGKRELCEVVELPFYRRNKQH